MNLESCVAKSYDISRDYECLLFNCGKASFRLLKIFTDQSLDNKKRMEAGRRTSSYIRPVTRGWLYISFFTLSIEHFCLNIVGLRAGGCVRDLKKPSMCKRTQKAAQYFSMLVFLFKLRTHHSNEDHSSPIVSNSCLMPSGMLHKIPWYFKHV